MADLRTSTDRLRHRVSLKLALSSCLVGGPYYDVRDPALVASHMR